MASQTNKKYVHKRTNSPNSKKKCSKPLPVGAWTSERTSINGYKWLDDSKSVGSKWLIRNTNAAGVQATAIPWNKSPQEFFKKGTSIILEREYDRDVQKSRPGAVVFALWYHTFYSNHSIIIVCFARVMHRARVSPPHVGSLPMPKPNAKRATRALAFPSKTDRFPLIWSLKLVLLKICTHIYKTWFYKKKTN